jgi:hypothetical protein
MYASVLLASMLGVSCLSFGWPGPIKDPLTMAAYFEAAKRPFGKSQYKAIFQGGSRSEQLNPGFAGAYRGLLARDGGYPISRLKNARAASSMLNTAVSVDEFDPKWRLLRLILETETPGWLGLSTHVQEDKAFLDRQLATEKPIEFGNSVNETPDSWVKFYMKLK